MRIHDRGRVLVFLAIVIGLPGTVSADLLVHEPFDYEEGWLTGQGGALGTTGTWMANETHNGDWRIHREGNASGIVVTADPLETNTFDGTVANLQTSGGYVGLPGPLDLDPPRGEDEDFEIGRNMDASIALDPAVTETFESGTTTWFSYVAVNAWDRNQECPNFMIGTDPSPSESRGSSLTNGGSGTGTGGGPPRDDRRYFYPMFFEGGNVHNVHGAWDGVWDNAAYTTPADGRVFWQASDDDGFGAANIVVGKIEWDADDDGQDIISLAVFGETETLSEEAFDAKIAFQPNLSTANWAEDNKPDLDQTQFDLINVAGLKFFVDEIRIATTFEEVAPAPGPVAPQFLRGDTDGNGSYTIGDGVQILERLFTGREAFASDCDDAGDTDDDGSLTIGDAVRLFNFQFAGGSPPAAPYPSCGPDVKPNTMITSPCNYPAANCP
ncbi:MAG: hypothetical protein JXP34_17265 [Planctomycetes bacterium]|nr:hypothetical protein [Planctomycetota bacterium]